MDDDDNPNHYYNAMYTQPHHSTYNIYDSATVALPDDDSTTESEDSVKEVKIEALKSNCKYLF